MLPAALAGATGAFAAEQTIASSAGPVVVAVGDDAVAGEAIVRLRGSKRERLVRLDPQAPLAAELARLEADPAVRWAIPNAVARIAAFERPDDPGRTGQAGGWSADQWNFLDAPPAGSICDATAPCGIGAPRAWETLESQGRRWGQRRDGSRGPVVAIVDTGVAYRNKGDRFQRNPDFVPGAFVGGRDFVDGDRVPLDRNGHGTHVAATIVERNDNGIAMTGLAPRARVMPVRVLGADGAGSAADVARGIRWAARKGAKVINLSLEFPRAFDSCELLRGVCRAIRRAERDGVLVVAAAGNVGTTGPQMPAKITFSVAASTIRGCISEFSSSGPGTDITAPGGGSDIVGAGDHCRPAERGPGVVQLTLRTGAALRGDFTSFGYPRFEGTSMAAPHVSGAAALVLASRVLHSEGKPPTPAEIEAHLECTSRPVSDPSAAEQYGSGLLDVGAAVDPGGCPA